MEKIMLGIKKEYASSSFNLYIVDYKYFFRWMEMPRVMEWLTVNNKPTLLSPNNLLKTEDIEKMIEATDDTMFKAFLGILWESMGRIGEVMSLKLSDLEEGDGYYRIMLNGKTGDRILPIAEYYDIVNDWIVKHPLKDDKDAPLFVFCYSGKWRTPSYRTTNTRLKKLAKSCGISKPVTPHGFRKGRCSHLAKTSTFTRSILSKMGGWAENSMVLERYIRLSVQDYEGDYVKMFGKGKDKMARLDSALSKMKVKDSELYGRLLEFVKKEMGGKMK